MVPQLGAKEKFYFTVYYITLTLNSNCEAQRASKNLKKNLDELQAKINALVI